MKKWIPPLIVFLTILLSACGFHLRNGQELPTSLHTIYYNPKNPYDPVASELQDVLSSLHIKLVTSPTQAPFTLYVSKSQTSHSNINFTDNSQAVLLSYRQAVHVALIDNATQKTLISNNFSASISQYLNQNQIMTTNTSSLATESLPHDIVTHIFIWLTTLKVRNTLFDKSTSRQDPPHAARYQH